MTSSTDQSSGDTLVPAVPCVHPPRLRDSSRAVELGGFLLRVGGISVVAALLLSLWPRTRTIGFAESKRDIAKATVRKYAFEAYPSWRAAHPDKACPARLEALNEYMNNKDLKDPWGGTYAFSCDTSGVLVWSAGEDGVIRTSDDLWSDR